MIRPYQIMLYPKAHNNIMFIIFNVYNYNFLQPPLKADFQLVEVSARAEIQLFAGENVTLKLNR